MYGRATTDGTKVDQWTSNGGDNQLWKLTYLGANGYEIVGVQSGKALEVVSTSTANGTDVDIRTYTGAANQRWTITATSGGYFTAHAGEQRDVCPRRQRRFERGRRKRLAMELDGRRQPAMDVRGPLS